MDLWDANEKELEIEYELEVERAYGIPYGKYINRMDTKYFDSDEYRQAFQLLTPDRELNECIYKYSKQSILDNWGTDKESMFLIDADSKDLIASIERNEDKISLGITYTKEFREALDKAILQGIKIVAVHNHPNGYPPSLDDISKAVENHYRVAIVAGSNGLVYKYHNNITLENKYRQAVRFMIQYLYENNQLKNCFSGNTKNNQTTGH